MELIMAFAFGLITGFICGAVPDALRAYFIRKNIEKLGEDEYVRLEENEDPDDVRDREKEEEANIRFF